jgi:predicted alpha/beta superfamily hydrolase
MSMPIVAIPDTEVHRMRSQSVGDDFELWIARPQPGFAPVPPGPVRVLYVLDANLFFGTAVEMTRLMYKLWGELPPLLVVGVAYPTDDGLLQGALRTRDFTPSDDPGMAAMSSSFPQSPEAMRIEPKMGGAAAFLDFLRKEVQPFVASRFDVRDDGATIFGSSLGGLFVADAFLTAPGAFDHYIVVSPALWWNQDDAFRVAATRKRLGADEAASLFVAVGGLEEAPEIPSLAPFKMVTNARRFAAELKETAEPSLDVLFVELEGESHTSVVPVALTRGLRSIYRRRPA